MSEITLESIAENHCALRVTLSTKEAPPVSLESVQNERHLTHQTHWTRLADDEYETVILGLSADSEVTVSITDTTPLQATARTRPLPADLPPIEQTVSGAIDSDLITIFPVFQFTPSVDPEWGYLVAVDALANIIWYQDIGHLSLLFSVTETNTVLYSHTAEALIEHHPRTGIVTTWEADNSALDTVHHEAYKRDNGGWALLSSEHQEISGFPNGQQYNIIGDVLAEVDSDGTVVWETSVLDFIDPTEYFTDDMHTTFWEQWPYDTLDTPKDWSHANAMIWNEARQEWMTSLRNIDRLAAFSRETGDLTWTFGPDGSFALKEGGRWFSRQHAPIWTSDTTVLLYDNGLQRRDAGEDEFPYTRVVEYALDFDTYVATELWSYSGSLPYLAPIVGQATPLPDGALLITDGAIFDGTIPVDGEDISHFSARIVELERTVPPQVRSELVIGTPKDLDTPGYMVYRAHRSTRQQFLGAQVHD